MDRKITVRASCNHQFTANKNQPAFEATSGENSQLRVARLCRRNGIEMVRQRSARTINVQKWNSPSEIPPPDKMFVFGHRSEIIIARRAERGADRRHPWRKRHRDSKAT